MKPSEHSFFNSSCNTKMFLAKIARCQSFSSEIRGVQIAKAYNCNFVRNFADKMGLPRVFFDMAADGNAVGRIVIEVSR